MSIDRGAMVKAIGSKTDDDQPGRLSKLWILKGYRAFAWRGLKRVNFSVPLTEKIVNENARYKCSSSSRRASASRNKGLNRASKD
jgi:hypothetical protein